MSESVSLEELEELFVNLLKKISKLEFKEQLALLVKEADRTKVVEFKVIIYLYMDYLITQYNTKGTTPFILPALSEIRQVASRVERREMELDELVKSGSDLVKLVPGKGLYHDSSPDSGSVKNDFYRGSSDVSSFYREQYKPLSVTHHYEQATGVKAGGDLEAPAGALERSLESPVDGADYEKADTRYMSKSEKSILDESKERDKKITYKV